MKSMSYLVVIEKAGRNYSAYSPDLPGCVATGRTRGETQRRMRTAIRMHLDGLAADGLPFPEARSEAAYAAID